MRLRRTWRYTFLFSSLSSFLFFSFSLLSSLALFRSSGASWSLDGIPTVNQAARLPFILLYHLNVASMNHDWGRIEIPSCEISSFTWLLRFRITKIWLLVIFCCFRGILKDSWITGKYFASYISESPWNRLPQSDYKLATSILELSVSYSVLFFCKIDKFLHYFLNWENNLARSCFKFLNVSRKLWNIVDKIERKTRLITSHWPSLLEFSVFCSTRPLKMSLSWD